MKLSDILNDQYPLDRRNRSSLTMRESVRTMYRKTLRESQVPQSGAYYWFPKPRGESHPRSTADVMWHIVEFYDEHYNDNTLHIDMWDGILELLSIRWNKDAQLLNRYLGNNYTALPRGRVNRVTLDNGTVGWTIVHGNDSPGPIQAVINNFNLSAMERNGRVKIYFDEHEQMDARDCQRLQTILGCKLNLKGVRFGTIA